MVLTLSHKQHSSLINRLLPAPLMQLKLIGIYSVMMVHGDRNAAKK